MNRDNAQYECQPPHFVRHIEALRRDQRQMPFRPNNDVERQVKLPGRSQRRIRR